MNLETAAEAFQSAGEIADLIVLLRSFEAAAETAARIGDFRGLATQLPQRLDDCCADEQRQKNRHNDRREKNFQDRQTHGVKMLADVVGCLRNENGPDDIAAPIKRQRRVQRHLPRRRRRNAFLQPVLSHECRLQFWSAKNL